MGTIISLVVGIGVVAAAIAFVVGCIVLSARNEKKGMDKVEEPSTAADIECEEGGEEYVAVPARVVDMKCEGHYEGNAKHPHHHVFFNVTFLTDGGETVRYSVGQTVFDRLSLNMTGDLVTVNGNFFDFSKGEPIE